MPDSVTIHHAAQLPGEESVLATIVDDLTSTAKLGVYADWLKENGDEERATFVRQYASALESGEGFPDSSDLPRAWLGITGALLVQACCENGLTDERMTLLELAKPSLRFESSSWDTSPLENDDYPVGATKKFGVPDLPKGMSWPRQADCKALFIPDSGIEPTKLCFFVAQINCKDLERTQLAPYFPKAGLISVFSCTCLDQGNIDAHVIYSPDTSLLVRMEAPAELEDDEANELANPVNFEFTETLELPYPHDESPFEQIRWGPQWASDDERPKAAAAELVLETIGCNSLSSIGGFTTPTSGDDPLPGIEWCKLICIETSSGSSLHFCIRYDDLASCDFDSVRLVWTDWD